MPYAEFIEQVQFYNNWPWGDDWQQAGTMAWASVVPHVRKRCQPEDFMPKTTKVNRPRQTPQQMAAVLNMLAQQVPQSVTSG